jgi:hypothetical protein
MKVRHNWRRNQETKEYGMNRQLIRLAAVLPLSLALAGATVPSAAQEVPQAAAMEDKPATGTAGAAIDPALQRMFMALATALVANFAASAARGSLDGFDPAPMLEAALKNALGSRELNRLLDRMVDQAGTGPDAAAMSPEMRALVKTALAGAVSMARAEITRELAPAPSAPASQPGSGPVSP